MNSVFMCYHSTVIPPLQTLFLIQRSDRSYTLLKFIRCLTNIGVNKNDLLCMKHRMSQERHKYHFRVPLLHPSSYIMSPFILIKVQSVSKIGKYKQLSTYNKQNMEFVSSPNCLYSFNQTFESTSSRVFSALTTGSIYVLASNQGIDVRSVLESTLSGRSQSNQPY